MAFDSLNHEGLVDMKTSSKNLLPKVLIDV